MPEINIRWDDPDLYPLLRKCSTQDLDPLVHYIIDKSWLASELAATTAYQLHRPDHGQYPDEIAAEIQKLGGNTILNILRGGKGVPYKDIVCDVADKLKANYNKARDVDFIEQQILLKVMEKAWEKMDHHQQVALLRSISLDPLKAMPLGFPVMALQTAIGLGGQGAYRLAAVVANAVAKALIGKGLSLAATTALSRFLALFAGPVGWAVTSLWTLFDLAGPAYRITVPCVIHVAMLRQKYALLDQGQEIEEPLEPDEEEEKAA